ncbi:UNVERIFIED_CONTAM: hypothetical protein FKN15_028635 [Acipenser sinensis]
MSAGRTVTKPHIPPSSGLPPNKGDGGELEDEMGFCFNSQPTSAQGCGESSGFLSCRDISSSGLFATDYCPASIHQHAFSRETGAEAHIINCRPENLEILTTGAVSWVQ